MRIFCTLVFIASVGTTTTTAFAHSAGAGRIPPAASSGRGQDQGGLLHTHFYQREPMRLRLGVTTQRRWRESHQLDSGPPRSTTGLPLGGQALMNAQDRAAIGGLVRAIRGQQIRAFSQRVESIASRPGISPHAERQRQQAVDALVAQFNREVQGALVSHGLNQHASHEIAGWELSATAGRQIYQQARARHQANTTGLAVSRHR